MAAITDFSALAVLATAEKYDLVAAGSEGHRDKVGASVAAITPGLVLAHPAGTPLHGFPFFTSRGKGNRAAITAFFIL